MKTTDTVLLAGAGIVAAAAAYQLHKARTGSGIGFATSAGDAQRLSGVQHLYDSSTGQQAGLDAAIAQSWRDLQTGVFASQPDFWA